MKRLMLALGASFVAIALAFAPPAVAEAPCHEHECHNDFECFEVGCLDGCDVAFCVPPN